MNATFTRKQADEFTQNQVQTQIIVFTLMLLEQFLYLSVFVRFLASACVRFAGYIKSGMKLLNDRSTFC